MWYQNNHLVNIDVMRDSPKSHTVLILVVSAASIFFFFFCLFDKLFISGKTSFFNKKELVFYRSTKIFKGNIGARRPLLVFPSFFCPELIKYKIFYLKCKYFVFLLFEKKFQFNFFFEKTCFVRK